MLVSHPLVDAVSKIPVEFWEVASEVDVCLIDVQGSSPPLPLTDAFSRELNHAARRSLYSAQPDGGSQAQLAAGFYRSAELWATG